MSNKYSFKVVLTRPDLEHTNWSNQLLAHGYDIYELPLLKTKVLKNPHFVKLHQLYWERLCKGFYDAAMFVSPAAVRLFLAPLSPHYPQRTSLDSLPQDYGWVRARLWATGSGTAQALMQLGSPVSQIDCPPQHSAQFDSQHLWKHVSEQIAPGSKVLVIRGTNNPHDIEGHGQKWLIEQLQRKGASVNVFATYHRHAPDVNVLDTATDYLLNYLEQTQPSSLVWLFSSSEGLRNLIQYLDLVDQMHTLSESLHPADTLAPIQTISKTQRLIHSQIAITTHPKIMLTARHIGFAKVCHTRPLVNDILDTLKQLQN